MTKVFGKSPSGEKLKKISTSPHYKKGQFQNIEETKVIAGKVSFFTILKDFANKPSAVVPSSIIPSEQTNLRLLKSKKPLVVWFGHSSYLINVNGFIILVDPVFSGNASPVGFFGKSFAGSDVYKVEDMPVIDLLVLTHDHYDHLDYKSILTLHPTVKKIVTSLGVGAHLEYWGVDTHKIVELDWWERQVIDPDTEITATPGRHFSGRGLKRGGTLWSSFVLNIQGYKIFIGGDSGYDKQFELIGHKFGGFDIAFLECGQYGENWPMIHMFPEQTVQAAKDLQAKILFPVHWSKFALANHIWNEPIKRLAIEAAKQQQLFVSPMIGQPYTFDETFDQKEWWNFERSAGKD